MLKRLAVLMVGGLFASAPALAQPAVHVGVSLGPPPVVVSPAPRVVYAPPIQRVWVDGYWSRDYRGRRVWVEGYWQEVRTPARVIGPPPHARSRHVHPRTDRVVHPRGRR